ncbi:MAG: preprotein translocase subunit YajC [Bacteroidales bacterium]|jgi:preprotein translocase subunit YajC|nr:preprotein translocase subunit YajC [Bacteroidales bacterium]
MNNLLLILLFGGNAAQSAGAEGGAQGGSPWMSLAFIVLLIVVFWLFFIRPQSKKAKEEQKFRDSLQKGDKVVTIGGFHGKIVEVKETTVVISLAPNTEVEVEKTALVKDSSRVGQA